jgi:DNA-binding NarL/FixJ family response regulator
MKRRIRVLSVDDHPLLREGIGALLGSQMDMELVAEAASGEDAITQFRKHQPDVTLMDLRLPGMSGLDAMTRILGEFPNARFLVLTTEAGDVTIQRVLEAGAFGYILKDMVRKQLLDAIRTVANGKKIVPPAVAARIAEYRETLSPREIDILRLIATGNSNKVIADRLSISEETVKAHMKSILSKLGVNTRTHAVAVAVQRGIISI